MLSVIGSPVARNSSNTNFSRMDLAGMLTLIEGREGSPRPEREPQKGAEIAESRMSTDFCKRWCCRPRTVPLSPRRLPRDRLRLDLIGEFMPGDPQMLLSVISHRWRHSWFCIQSCAGSTRSIRSKPRNSGCAPRPRDALERPRERAGSLLPSHRNECWTCARLEC